MILRFKPIQFKNNKIIIIDQTRLPQKLEYRIIDNYQRLSLAIRRLELRGAPLIGVGAAFGIAMEMSKTKARTFDQLYTLFKRVKSELAATRPTAFNLFYALNRMEKVLLEHNEKRVEQIKKIITKEAENIYKEDLQISMKIGSYGSRLIQEGDTILTHCNAGGLATSGLGTALAVLFYAKSQKKKFRVIVDETRPLLQGARLTTWELEQYKIPHYLICDNMAAQIIKKEKVKKIIVGADRITKNGDAANKIGTYNLAILAKYHKIPFYIAAPSTTFDLSLKNGSLIPIEERHKDEIILMGDKKIAHNRVRTFNPAFDVTPQKLISGFITEYGILKPPFLFNFQKLS